MIIATRIGARVDAVHASVATIPTDSPESDGTAAWDATTIVVVEVSAGGARGLGYTYGDAAAAGVVRGTLAGVVEGRDAMATGEAWWAMARAVRNMGRPGIASHAVSAVDVALWDLKARLLELPLATLLGPVRNRTAVYGSGGFTSYSLDELTEQLASWVASGIGMVKMKVGRDPAADPERVRAARKAIGDEAQLFVDANGAYTRTQALQLAQRFAAEAAVTWFEEPVSSDDAEGLRWLCERAPAGMAIAAGEYGYTPFDFRRLLEAGAVDVLQADVTRCGGITGLLAVGALCQAHAVPLSAHTAPAIHAHACCAIAPAVHLEYFHDHARIERMLFDGTLQPEAGALAPDLGRSGLGLELRRAELERWAS